MKYSSTLLIATLAGMLSVSQYAAAASVDQVSKQALTEQGKSAKTQSEIDRLDKRQSALDLEYRALLLTLVNAENYNAKLERQITKLDDNIHSINVQLESVANIDREIAPLMLQMLQSLQAFVEADLPFEQTFRLEQLEHLAQQIADPTLGASAKYQKLLQAFVEEDQYAQQMYSSQGVVVIDGVNRQVNFLRLGRVAWYYQKLDGSDAAIWQRGAQRWLMLSKSGNAEISKAIDMASGVGIPQLIHFELAGDQL